ncbi:MAG: hypothetical protein JNJ60_13235 [Rhodocyclaceae bacterium]|nr:hypothetical protein [Rhodocyclaceae bacterium]
MLTITASQLEQLDRTQRAQFITSLSRALHTAYADYSRLSPVVLCVLVSHALARAQCYGLSRPSSLAQFVHLMAALAPNFDTHPALHAGLTNQAVGADERIDVLMDSLPDGVWAEAAANSSNLGWYLSSDMGAAAPAERIAAALVHALPQNAGHALADALPAVAQSCRRAAQLGLQGEDAAFTFSACSLLYGAGFETRMAWSADIFAPQLGAALRSALLKARAAIDHGVWL